MKKQIAIILFSTLCFNLYAGISVKDMLSYLKSKVDQAYVHITNTTEHIVGNNKVRFDNAITNNQDTASFGTLIVSDTNTAYVLNSISGDIFLSGINYKSRIINSITNEQDLISIQLLASHTNNSIIHLSDQQIQKINNSITNEQDLAALRTYHYGSPNIIESPGEWFIHDGAGTITGINEESVTNWDIVIPWQIGGVPVTEIGANAFAGSGVTSIVGAGDVVTVGDSAFSSCRSLTSVSFPQVQTVGDSAFSSCESLTSVLLPQLQTVRSSAFEFCTSLTSVSFPQLQTVGYYAFSNCGGLTSVSLPQVQTVGYYAFSYCISLASVSLPLVQTVGNLAFADCYGLASVSFPHVQTVGDSAFSYCESLTSVLLPQLQTVGPYAFEFCGSLASIPLPQVQTVGYYAFFGCYSLTSLYFDGNAPTIGFEIFANITPNQVTNYVTNPTATGWGETFGGMPVVRLPLHADALVLNGTTYTNILVKEQSHPYPVFKLDLGEHWTDFEIKATTNGYAVEGNSGSNLVYYYASWTADQYWSNPDTNAWAYYTDDYASDPRVWIRKGLTNSIADQLANTGSVVSTVYFFPSRDCECGWMRRDNTNLVWSWLRVSDGEYEKRLDGAKTRWRPIRPESWESGRTTP